jgi:hypothetical protein
MRGKERFSAPENSLDSIMRFSAGETTSGKLAVYPGTALLEPLNVTKDQG